MLNNFMLLMFYNFYSSFMLDIILGKLYHYVILDYDWNR